MPTPHHFELVASLVTEDQVADKVVCGPDPQPALDAVRTAVDSGIDHIYFHQVGPDQDAFFQFWRDALRPAIDEALGASTTANPSA